MTTPIISYDILDDKRKEVLPLLYAFKEDYYLAGGTALALQIGHRRSIDFDFFRPQSFSTIELFQQVNKVFAGHNIQKIQDEKDTLTVIIDDEVKISFFSYPYILLDPLLDERSLKIASMTDIGCMKLSTIVSRATLKDYVDLYLILQKISLAELLEKCKQKLPMLDANLVLKSLVYFDDVIEEPIDFLQGHEVTFEEIKNSITERVNSYFKSI